MRIRLRRMGRRKLPYYRFVAIDQRVRRDGRALDTLGWYRPLERPAKLSVDYDKTAKWLDAGAEMSDTVHALFRQNGLTDKYRRQKAGEDVSGVALATEITETKHRVKAKARARMAEKAESEAKAAEEAAAAPTDEAAAEKSGEETPAAEDAKE